MRAKRVDSVCLIACIVFTCFLLAESQGKYDHQSHAVPGKDRTVKDFDGDGFAEVLLNGELSHSHYFNPKNSSDSGRIVEYKWTENRLNSVIGTQMKFKHMFPVGETIVTLFVRDHKNDTSANSITITVEPSGTQGGYMYYYDMVGVEVKPWILSVIDKDEHRPKFGAAVKSADLIADKWPSLPKSVTKGPFTIQLLFDFLALTDDTYHFFIAISSGYASLHVQGKQVAWTRNKGESVQVLKSDPAFMNKGKHAMQLRYFTADPTKPICIVGVQIKDVVEVIPQELMSYEAHSVIPTIHKVWPPHSTLSGGGQMWIDGAGFYGDVGVYFGETKGWNIQVKSPEKIQLQIPSNEFSEDILVSVKTHKGDSNEVPFSYNLAAPMPIKFKQDYVRYKNGTLFPSKQFSCVALGPDMRYYFGSLDSHVHVVSIKHETMTVNNQCKSVGMGMGITIAGIAFNPSDTTLRVYISTNMFYWRDYYNIPDKLGWHNGKVQTLVRGTKGAGICLIHENDLITGLPVSNHDHGVNNLVFDNEGNLYIQVGGSTNAGVSKPDDLVGGVKESELSSATVIAYLRAPGFNGTITYDRYDDPEKAKPLTPKKYIEAFAYGFRNSFGCVYHTSGNIFATDNGPNEGYGPASTSCTTESSDPWHPDSLVMVTKGAYFGYPNRARGLRGDERQCVYYHPTSVAKRGFTPHLATFEASTNGVIEYTANCFEGQMKGDLLISKYAVQGNGKLYRAQLDATKQALKEEVKELQDFSGLSMVMNPFGALVMPRVQQPNIAVLYPDEEYPVDKQPRLTAVHPYRGPKIGGNWVIITGKNLSKKPYILFGKKECTLLKADEKQQKWALCAVPSGEGSVEITITTPHGETTSRHPDYHYMKY